MYHIYTHIYFQRLFKCVHTARHMAQTMNYLIVHFLICTRSMYTIYIFFKKTLQVILFLSARSGHPVTLLEGFWTAVEPR